MSKKLELIYAMSFFKLLRFKSSLAVAILAELSELNSMTDLIVLKLTT